MFVFVNQEVKNLENTNFGFCYFLVLSITIINIFLFHILEKTEKLYEEKIEIAAAMEKVKYREVYYSELEKHQEEIRIIKHDLKNQLYVISDVYKRQFRTRRQKAIARVLIIPALLHQTLGFPVFCQIGNKRR